MGRKLVGSVGLAPGSDSGFDLDTKGQIHGYSSTQFALDVGTANQSVIVDSSATAGIKWGASATSVLNATGDILYASGANTLAKLAKGDNDEILTLKSGLPSWEASSGGGAWTKIGNDSGTSLDVGSLADYDMYMVVGSCLCDTNGGKLQMQINSDGSNEYDYEQGKKGSWSGVAAGHIEISDSPAGSKMQNIFVGYFTQRQFSEDMHNFFIMDNPSVVGAGSNTYAIRCYGQHDEAADISSFQITASSGSLHASSSMNVYGLNLSA